VNDIGGVDAAADMIAVDRAAADLRRGRFVIIENGRDAAITQAAEAVTPESLAALGRIGNGEARLALTARRASVLNLDAGRASFVTLPLSARIGAPAVRRLADPTAEDGDLPDALALDPAPAHSLPSAAIKLSKLAQMLPAAVTAPLAGAGAARHGGGGLLRVGMDAIEDYPRLSTTTLTPVTEARVPLADVENVRIVGFRPADGGIEQFAIVVGDPAAHQPALCRLHSECFTGDLLGSLRCDCGPQLKGALRLMSLVGHGVVLYLAHEGRGIGLVNKLRAYRLQDAGLDTIDANRHLGFDDDERSFQAAAVMLGHLGIDRVRLLTNNPAKVDALLKEGIAVAERVPHGVPANRHNRAYLETKVRRAGHWLESEP